MALPVQAKAKYGTWSKDFDQNRQKTNSYNDYRTLNLKKKILVVLGSHV